MLRIHINKKAFTLVELMIAITIVSILSVIWFISYSNYNIQARDTSRLSDVRNITNILDLNYTLTRLYPSPTEWIDVSYSGATVWTQWVFGMATAAEIWKIFWDLRDPKYGNHYTYSVTSNKREYQLAVLFESPQNRGSRTIASNPLQNIWATQVYASDVFSPEDLNPIIWLDSEDVTWDGNLTNNPSDGSNFSTWVNKWTLWASWNPTVTHGNIRYTNSWYQGNRNSVFFPQNWWVRLDGSSITQWDIFQVIQKRNPFWSTNQNGRWLQSANNNNYTIGYHGNRRNSLRIWNSPNALTSSPAISAWRTNPFIYGFHTNGVNYSFRESWNVISQWATSSISWQTWAYNRAWSQSNQRSDFVIAEILIFDQALSEEDRLRVEGYLAHRWDMTWNLSSTHPYRNNPPAWVSQDPPNTYLISLHLMI